MTKDKNKLQIIHFPDLTLQISVKYMELSLDNLNYIKHNINTMLDIMFNNNGIGLAANQIGINLRFFIMVINDSKIIAINPKITKYSGILYEEEGCLSIPGISSKVKRYKDIVMTAYNEKGKKYAIKSSGIQSICIQHEIDHLNGILYLDRISKLKKEILIKKFNKFNKLKQF